MKKILFIAASFYTVFGAQAQNVGIGMVNPTEKLEVNGAVKIGTSSTNSPAAGTIRWNSFKNDFEGYNGSVWLSLTGGKTGWGNNEHYSTENDGVEGYNSDTAFGSPIAVYNDLIVAGIPKYQYNNYQNAGKVMLYKFYSHGLFQQVQVHPPSPGANKLFGKSVSLFEDVVAIGEPGASPDGSIRQGLAHIFRIDDNNNTAELEMSLQQTAAEGDPFNSFGATVALASKDLVAVAAPEKAVGGNARQGKVYIFRRGYFNGQPTPVFVQEAGFTAPDGNAEMLFGSAISFTPNCIAVGAPDAIENNVKAGKVYIFRRINNLWQYEATLKAGTPNPGAEFGSAISLNAAGDTVIVGAPGLGQVYVFRKNGNTWTGGGVNIGSGLSMQHSRLGSAVAYKDGTIVAGAEEAPIGIYNQQGKAYVFKHSGVSWKPVAVLTPQHGEAYMRFGAQVQFGNNRIVIGAPGYASSYFKASKGRLFSFEKE